MLVFRSYNVVVRHSTIRDLANFVFIFLTKVALMGILMWVVGMFSTYMLVALLYDMLLSVFLIICVRLLMVYMYDSIRSRLNGGDSSSSSSSISAVRVLAYGLSDKSVASIKRFQNSPHYKLIGFLSDKHQDQSMKISDYPIYVYEGEEDLKNITTNMSVGAIMFSTEADAERAERPYYVLCQQRNQDSDCPECG